MRYLQAPQKHTKMAYQKIFCRALFEKSAIIVQSFRGFLSEPTDFNEFFPQFWAFSDLRFSRWAKPKILIFWPKCPTEYFLLCHFEILLWCPQIPHHSFFGYFFFRKLTSKKHHGYFPPNVEQIEIYQFHLIFPKNGK